MSDVHAAAKVQVVLYPALPSTCAVCYCSANGQKRFLDFQTSLDYYGAVAVCEDCGREMLNALDCHTNEEYTALYAQWMDAEALSSKIYDEVAELKEENARFRTTLDGILTFRPDLRDDSNINALMEQTDDPASDSKRFATERNVEPESKFA